MSESTETFEERIQRIFNIVIEAKLYPRQDQRYRHVSFMCEALEEAVQYRLISGVDAVLAKNEIHKCIRPFITMAAHLKNLDLPYEVDNRLEIYSNWSNRPQRRRKEHAVCIE